MASHKYLNIHDPALQQLEDILARAGQTGRYISYGELVKGVDFHPQNSPAGLVYNVASSGIWNYKDQELVGEYLSYISERSLQKGGFLASALVVGQYAGPTLSAITPGEGFFTLARNLGVLTKGKEKEYFFLNQISKAHDYYRNGGAVRLTP